MEQQVRIKLAGIAITIVSKGQEDDKDWEEDDQDAEDEMDSLFKTKWL